MSNSEFLESVRRIKEVCSTVHNEKLTIDEDTGEVLTIELLNPLTKSEWEGRKEWQ